MRILFTLTTVALLFPDHFFISPSTGLDPSWQLALHMAFEKGLKWGNEIAFTYGPLGFLSTRMPFPSLARAYLISDIFVTCQLALVTWQLSSLLVSSFSVIAGLGLVAIFGWSPFYIELPLLLFTFTLFALGKFANNGSTKWLALAAIDAALTLFIKVNVGLFGILQCLAATLFIFFSRKQDWSALVQNLIISLIPAIIAWLVLPVAIIPYVKNSMALASGFVDSMGVTFPNRQSFLLLGAITLAGWTLALITNLRATLGSSLHLLIAALGSLNLFLLFKQGFVRADGHELSFFTFAPVTMLVAAYLAESALRKGLLQATLVAIGCALPIWHDHFTFEVLRGQMRGLKEYPQEARKLLELKASGEKFALPTPASQLLSQPTRNLIGSAGIDAVPWDAAVIYYNGLNYQPRPIIQSYSAYTKELIEINERAYRSALAPEFVLLNNYCIDGRLCQGEDFGTQKALLESYNLIGEDAGVLLAQRRPESRVAVTTQLNQGRAKLEEWVTIPAAEGITLLRADVHYSLPGLARLVLFKPAETRLLLRLDNGEVRDFRAVRGALAYGIPISRLIEEKADLKKLHSGRWSELRRVSAFQIKTSSSFGLAPEYDYLLTDYVVHFGD